MFHFVAYSCRLVLRQNFYRLVQPYGKCFTVRVSEIPKFRFATSSVKGCIAFTVSGVLSGYIGCRLFSQNKYIHCQAATVDSQLPNEKPLVQHSNLVRLIGSDILYLLGAILGAILAALANVQIPLLLGALANAISSSVLDQQSYQAIYLPAGQLCAVYLIQSVSTFFYVGLLASFGERLAIKLRYELFEKLVYQDVAFFDVHSSGKLVDGITADVQTFKSSLKQSISQGLRGSIQAIGSVYALFSISPTLTTTLICFLPVVFLTGSLIGKELRRLSREAQAQSSSAAAVIEEAFSHIRSVKSLVMEPELLRRFSAQTLLGLSLNEKLGYGIGLFQGLSNFTLNGIVLAVLYMGGRLVSRNDLTIGDLMSFLTTTLALERSLAQLSLLYGQLVRGRAAYDRILETLHASVSIEGPVPLGSSLTSFEHRTTPTGVRFEGVSFAYPSRSDSLVLNGLDFEVPAGKVVALVGPSGAGKSTVVSLIERFYNPVNGRVLIGESDVRDLALTELRGKLVGYISQEAQIFNTTVRENIRCGRPEATDIEVEAVARLANAHDFIVDQLPEGYDTPVGRGTGSTAGLSGGQRQRIAIARVLLKNAPVLLMDEATSALDAESEALVQQALETAMKGRTVLIIAHRLSTIRKADHIIVVRSGRIAEQGAHDELMQKRGSYYNLVRHQGGHDIIK